MSSNPLSKEHLELYHYTGAAGLKGIIESQTLWATHYKYLNDSSEVIHFKERLSHLVSPTVRFGVQELIKQAPENQKIVDDEGGFESAVENALIGIIDSMFQAALEGDEPLVEPYITSFCSVKNDPEHHHIKQHGLLSQWRGYGVDGGYAIVFTTRRLEELMALENEKWQYPIIAGNALYSNFSDDIIIQEMGDDYEAINNSIKNFLITQKRNSLEAAFNFVYYACRYKHRGFEEEQEVRLVVLPPSAKTLELAAKQGKQAADKPKNHYMRAGTPVPYIKLFEGLSRKLPIERIIVGPHPQKEQRKRAVEILLKENKIDADVTLSDIPYLGR